MESGIINIYMKPLTKFFKEFEKKVSDCDNNCKHYYVKYIYKNDSEHYQLLCDTHGYRLNVPRDIALADISDGALWINKGEDSPFFYQKNGRPLF